MSAQDSALAASGLRAAYAERRLAPARRKIDDFASMLAHETGLMGAKRHAPPLVSGGARFCRRRAFPPLWATMSSRRQAPPRASY